MAFSRTTRTLLAALVLASAAAAQAEDAQERGATPPEGRAVLPADLDLPAAAPHVAVDDGTALVVFAADEEIWCAVARAGGASFDAPVRVGAAGRLESGLARGPRAAVLPDALAVLAICGRQGQGRDGDLLAWRSADGGLTWKGPVRVNDVGDSAREGLFALAAGPGGQLFGTWLDLRGGGTELWADWSLDGGATWGEDVLAYRSPDGSICECCAPAAAFDPGSGDAVAMWRNKLGANRDMFARVLRRGAPAQATEPQPLGDGHWELQACPMAGGGVAVSARGELLTFWRRGQGLYTAAPGLSETQVGEGREASAAAGPAGFHLAFTDTQGRVLTALAPHLGGVQDARVLGRGVNVTAAGAPDGNGPVLAAWETGEGTAASLRFERLAERRPPATR
jgi:hypothetical protein